MHFEIISFIIYFKWMVHKLHYNIRALPAKMFNSFLIQQQMRLNQ